MNITSFVADRLRYIDSTSYVDGNGEFKDITTEDGCARCSPSHCLPDSSSTYSNMIQEHEFDSYQIEHSMAEFYKNSLLAGDPLVPDTIICRQEMDIKGLPLKRIDWVGNSWFIISSKTGILSDKWWHIYGCIHKEIGVILLK